MGNGDKKSVAKASGDTVPHVDPETFQEIVEGRRRCPTISELGALADRDLHDCEALPGDARIRQHLPKCEECAELYAMIKLVTQVGDRAATATAAHVPSTLV